MGCTGVLFTATVFLTCAVAGRSSPPLEVRTIQNNSRKSPAPFRTTHLHLTASKVRGKSTMSVGRSVSNPRYARDRGRAGFLRVRRVRSLLTTVSLHTHVTWVLLETPSPLFPSAVSCPTTVSETLAQQGFQTPAPCVTRLVRRGDETHTPHSDSNSRKAPIDTSLCQLQANFALPSTSPSASASGLAALSLSLPLPPLPPSSLSCRALPFRGCAAFPNPGTHIPERSARDRHKLSPATQQYPA